MEFPARFYSLVYLFYNSYSLTGSYFHVLPIFPLVGEFSALLSILFTRTLEREK